MNLDDLQQLAKELKQSSKRDAAVEGMLHEASAALADILTHLESSGPELAKALAKAMEGVRLQIDSAKPATINVSPTPVKVEVSPTPIDVHVAPSPVAVNVAASPVAVNVMPSAKGTQWRVDVERDSLTNDMHSFTITRL